MNRYTPIILSLLLFACAGEEKPKQALTEEDKLWQKAQEQDMQVLSLADQVKMLQDSIYRYETLAFRSEENKLNGMQTLIEEIEVSMAAGGASELKQLHAVAKAALYTKGTMANESAMEDYDKKVDDMVNAMKAFREQHSEFERHARAKIIYDDILKAYNDDLLIRNHYNIAVSNFNKLLAEKGSEIKKLGNAYKQIKPYPFFYGTDPVLPDA